MKRIVTMLFCLMAIALWSKPISLEVATNLAHAKIQQLYPQLSIASAHNLCRETQQLAYVFKLNPSGYMVISSRDDLPPLLAYSRTADFGELDNSNPLYSIILTDLNNRLLSEAEAIRNLEAWQNPYQLTRFEQWPPEGYSATEGWIKTNWTQNGPYNWMCPIDPITSNRSIAGCPTVAMSQILNFHQVLNGTRLNDTDDYYHNYSGRNYWIDNDYATHGFPSFPQLNGYLDQINYRFRYGQSLTDSCKAALIFACGTALTQIYSSSGSGTFGVSQAYDAFQRFGFSQSELLVETSPNLYPRISSNIKDALPVHLAIVTPEWDAGHNVVIDGYNTNDYYHLNFGWGGTYNGWYLLPSQIPYGLTVIEGAVVDIIPHEYVFTVPDTLVFNAAEAQMVEVINLHNGAIILEDLLPDANLQTSLWQITPSQPLPATIPENGMLSIQISCAGVDRDYIEANLRLILDQGFSDVPIRYSSALSVEDNLLPLPTLKANVYPNPFSDGCKLAVENPATQALSLDIYNLKGQKVHSSNKIYTAGQIDLLWNGKNMDGSPCAAGIYLYKIRGLNASTSGKVLRLK